MSDGPAEDSVLMDEHLVEVMDRLQQARWHLAQALLLAKVPELEALIPDLVAAQALVRKVHVLTGSNKAAIKRG